MSSATHGVPVHRRVVETGQRQRRHDVVGEDEAERVATVPRRSAARAVISAGDDPLVLFDGPHG